MLNLTSVVYVRLCVAWVFVQGRPAHNRPVIAPGPEQLHLWPPSQSSFLFNFKWYLKKLTFFLPLAVFPILSFILYEYIA